MHCYDPARGGHHFKDVVRLGPGRDATVFRRCTKWVQPEHRECGRWVCVGRVGSDLQGVLVVEVSLAEVKAWHSWGDSGFGPLVVTDFLEWDLSD